MIKLGFSLKPGWCSPDDPGSFLDFLITAGVGAVETTLSSSGALEWKVAEAALARGLTVTFHIAWSKEAHWDWYREWNTKAGRTGFDRLLTMLDGWAERQGEPTLVVVHPFDNGCNQRQGFTTTVVFCRWLVERTMVQDRRVQWVIENMPHDPNVPSRPGDRIEEIDEIVTSVPGLGICWDVGHWYLTRVIDPTWSGLLTNHFVAHVTHVHVHDYTREQGDHLPPGRGTIPLAASLHRLRTTGYDGWLTLELDYNKALHFGEPQDVVRDALTVVRQAWSGTVV